MGTGDYTTIGGVRISYRTYVELVKQNRLQEYIKEQQMAFTTNGSTYLANNDYANQLTGTYGGTGITTTDNSSATVTIASTPSTGY